MRLVPLDPEFPCIEVPAETLPSAPGPDALFLVQLTRAPADGSYLSVPFLKSGAPDDVPTPREVIKGLA